MADTELKAPILESEKLYYDAMKHLTTLSSGSILLIITFIEKLFKDPRNKFLVVITLCSFVFSILCSLSSMLQSANYIKHSGKKFRDLETKIKLIIYILSIAAFFLGFTCLVIFAVINFTVT